MLRLFVTVLPGLLPLALLTMGLSATLSVGEGRDKPISSRWRLFGLKEEEKRRRKKEK